MAGMNGIATYQQNNSIWNQQAKKTEETKQNTKNDVTGKTNKDIKTSLWKPIDTKSSLVPTQKDGVGMAIGDVQLSDQAKDYYTKLKAKFQNMEFIAVSKDMKSQVQANVAAYGNAHKQVVLIDDEKIEKMATDESFRKKYEGIIAMSELQLQNAKNSLTSSGASVKNFGMSVDENGKTSFFATIEKQNAKKAAEKKAKAAKDKKVAEKKAKEKKAAEKAAEKKAKEAKEKDKVKEQEPEKEVEDKKYIELKSDSLEDLVNQVSKFAYDSSSSTVVTESEKQVGQKIDFKG